MQRLVAPLLAALCLAACSGAGFSSDSPKAGPKPPAAPAPHVASATPVLGKAPAAGAPGTSASPTTGPATGGLPAGATTLPNQYSPDGTQAATAVNVATAANAAAATASAGATSSVPTGAQVKGSFAIWSEPADPPPYEPYQVVVDVTLPSGTATEGRGDLTGTIDGTEGVFHFTLGSDQFRASSFTVAGGHAQLRTWIPGDEAAPGYGDVITVHSGVLNETQSFSVAF